MKQTLAEVYMLTGENAKAIELLDGLLSRPGDLTVACLKLDPAMDRLRDDPEFQEVLPKHEGGEGRAAVTERPSGRAFQRVPSVVCA